jgi:hypothetical protein
MRRLARSPRTAAPLATPLDELDPATFEVLDADRPSPLAGLPRWPDDDSLREVSAGRPSGGDPTGTRGIWTAIGNA